MNKVDGNKDVKCISPVTLEPENLPRKPRIVMQEVVTSQVAVAEVLNEFYAASDAMSSVVRTATAHCHRCSNTVHKCSNVEQ